MLDQDRNSLRRCALTLTNARHSFNEKNDSRVSNRGWLRIRVLQVPLGKNLQIIFASITEIPDFKSERLLGVLAFDAQSHLANQYSGDTQSQWNTFTEEKNQSIKTKISRGIWIQSIAARYEIRIAATSKLIRNYEEAARLLCQWREVTTDERVAAIVYNWDG